MKRKSLYIVYGLISFYSCKNPTISYKNNLGIEPGVIAQMDLAHYTQIEWEEIQKDFGIVRQGDSVYVKFKFKNIGHTPLFITKVQPSCGCLITQYPHETIFPMGKGEVVTKFSSKFYPGFIHKAITVTSNTSNGISHLLSFTGQVIDSIRKPLH